MDVPMCVRYDYCDDQGTIINVHLRKRRKYKAVLLADSFAQKFRPITLERPKVLLPLVNAPMIEYTLAWLESVGVEEVFVFCCAHAQQVKSYLESSQWKKQSGGFCVTTIESHDAISAGDALRVIYSHGVPSTLTHQTRLGNDEIVMAIDPETKELLYYEDKLDFSQQHVSLDKMLLADNASLYLHNDKQDCYIDICSPEVLSLFTDNFDYQHLRRHFVKGLLVDDIMGYKIFIHEIHSSYAARVDNFRSYDTISKDILQRWTYPFVPDVQYLGNCLQIKLDRQGIYKAPEVILSRSARIDAFTLIGYATTVGDGTVISNSVIGQGSVLQPGVILSFKVEVGQKTVVPAYAKVSHLPQPCKQDSDEELEYADANSGVVQSPTIATSLNTQKVDLAIDFTEADKPVTSEVFVPGAAYIWSSLEGVNEDEWRHSIAPIPAEKFSEFLQKAYADINAPEQDVNIPAYGEILPDSESTGFGEGEDYRDSADFDKEVEATFQRAVAGVNQDNVILEINSLRLSYNMSHADCAGALFNSIMKAALVAPHSSKNELYKITVNEINKWRNLLKNYLKTIDEEIEVILKFEEICLETAREFSPVFSSILSMLYEIEVISEDAILLWAQEKEGADESDRVFLKQSEQFIKWLKEAPEEDEDDD
ncbi:hypothetical protein HPP92_016926 [Vanilla planifolia]|uniref:Translation initiation factor eIF2B subunit epsilon n=1 Tax=Vanilla planifolia TaxID=51239 RepID=A0A835QBT4_VANPL|nr:hypothetical protein HPP92_016926 [Vanilla planifolia]